MDFVFWTFFYLIDRYWPEIGNPKVWPTNLPTNQLTWVGARDTCVSKNMDRSIDLAVQRMPISLGQKPWSWTLSGGEQLIYLVSIGGLENSKNYFQRNAVWRDSSTYYVIHCHSCLFIAKLNSRIQVILGAAGYYYLKYLWFFVGPLSVRPRRGVFTLLLLLLLWW